MATDLLHALKEPVAKRLQAWLREEGAAEAEVELGPATRPEMGDLALPCHPYARFLRRAPQKIAEGLAEVAAADDAIESAVAVNGFLNLRLDWGALAERVIDWAKADAAALGRSAALEGRKVVIEFSSPNTNKPQHLGHCRNNLLGATVARLMGTAGAEVTRVNLVNDRGIHICKSMVAYRRWGANQTPESTGMKGDHLIGDFYVQFERAFAEEYAAAYPNRSLGKDEYFNTESALGGEAREMLRAWEQGDPQVRELWHTLNDWCTEGFWQTYARMGVEFDQVDLESETYLLGKDLVHQGLQRGIFRRDESGAVVFDLERIGLEGPKAVMRSDGTSVYTTQDLGTAVRRWEQHGFDQMVYVVGNEQEHHFRVLFGILCQLRPELEGRLTHLSYGMVELPEGKMKSREGKVVDADDLMDEVVEAASEEVRERNPELDREEAARRGEAIGLGGLKYFLLKYAPQTTFVFDKKSSISITGDSGAYCQYAYARGSSIVRKAEALGLDGAEPDYAALTHPRELDLYRAMLGWPGDVATAAAEARPNLLTKALYDLAKAFAGFFNESETRVIGDDVTPEVAAARLELVRAARRVLRGGLELLGIEPLEEM